MSTPVISLWEGQLVLVSLEIYCSQSKNVFVVNGVSKKLFRSKRCYCHRKTMAADRDLWQVFVFVITTFVLTRFYCIHMYVYEYGVTEKKLFSINYVENKVYQHLKPAMTYFIHTIHVFLRCFLLLFFRFPDPPENILSKSSADFFLRMRNCPSFSFKSFMSFIWSVDTGMLHENKSLKCIIVWPYWLIPFVSNKYSL